MLSPAASPPGAPVAMQRARGVARLGVKRGGRLVSLYQEGSAKVRFCACADGVREAVLINTGGGLAGGDNFAWSVGLGPGGQARVVTQACDRAYRSAGAAAQVSVSLDIAAGATLEWLPQETLLFQGAYLERRFDANVAADGRLLMLEAVILGRPAMGETQISARLTDRWRIHHDGRLVFTDSLRLEDTAAAIHRPALLQDCTAFATLLLVAPDAEQQLAAVRTRLGAAGGASAFGGKLVCRILAPDGQALRRTLMPALAALRGGAPAPRLWTV